MDAIKSLPRDVLKYHGAFVHHICPEDVIRPKDLKRQSDSLRKLSSFSEKYFTELSDDMYQELQRRSDPERRQKGPLDPIDGIHWKRNDARRQVAKLSDNRFRDICCDLITEQERRYPELRLGPTYPPIDSLKPSGAAHKTPKTPQMQNVLEGQVLPQVVDMVESDSEDEYEDYTQSRQEFLNQRNVLNGLPSEIAETDADVDNDVDFSDHSATSLAEKRQDGVRTPPLLSNKKSDNPFPGAVPRVHETPDKAYDAFAAQLREHGSDESLPEPGSPNANSINPAANTANFPANLTLESFNIADSDLDDRRLSNSSGLSIESLTIEIERPPQAGMMKMSIPTDTKGENTDFGTFSFDSGENSNDLVRGKNAADGADEADETDQQTSQETDQQTNETAKTAENELELVSDLKDLDINKRVEKQDPVVSKAASTAASTANAATTTASTAISAASTASQVNASLLQKTTAMASSAASAGAAILAAGLSATTAVRNRAAKPDETDLLRALSPKLDSGGQFAENALETHSKVKPPVESKEPVSVAPVKSAISEPIQQIEKIQPIEPAEKKPIEPVEKIQPIEPVEKIEKTEKIKKIKPVEAKPEKRIEPVQPVPVEKRNEPVQPVPVEVPVEPVAIEKQIEPVQPVEQNEPIQPVEKQIEPTKPVQPVMKRIEPVLPVLPVPVQPVEKRNEPIQPVRPVAVEVEPANRTGSDGHAVPPGRTLPTPPVARNVETVDEETDETSELHARIAELEQEAEARAAEDAELRVALERQQEVSNEVRGEAARVINEMRDISAQCEALNAENDMLREEVSTIKTSYEAKLADQPPKPPKPQIEQPKLPPDLPADLVSKSGAVKEADLRNCLAGITKLVEAVHSDLLPTDVLNSLHKTMLSARKFDDALVETAANSLIAVTRNFLVCPALFPQIIVDAACSDLSAAVLAFVDKHKVVEDVVKAASKRVSVVSLSTVERVTSGESQANAAATANAGHSRATSRSEVVSRHSRASSLAQTSESPRPDVQFVLSVDESVKQLQMFLEEHTSDSVEAIGALLTGIKENAEQGELKPLVRQVRDLIAQMVEQTEQSVNSTRNRLLREKGSYLCDSLRDYLSRIDMLYKDEMESANDASRPNRQLKQRLAGVSFDMAKSTKELVKTVEDILLREELTVVNQQN